MANEKKKDRFYLLSALISLGIVAVILAAVLLFPLIEARAELSRAEKAFDGMAEGDTLLLSDPLFGGDGLEKAAEVAMNFEDGEDIADIISDILSDAKYSKTKKTSLGAWARSASVRSERGAFTVYFTDDGFFLSKLQKGC